MTFERAEANKGWLDAPHSSIWAGLPYTLEVWEFGAYWYGCVSMNAEQLEDTQIISLDRHAAKTMIASVYNERYANEEEKSVQAHPLRDNPFNTKDVDDFTVSGDYRIDIKRGETNSFWTGSISKYPPDSNDDLRLVASTIAMPYRSDAVAHIVAIFNAMYAEPKSKLSPLNRPLEKADLLKVGDLYIFVDGVRCLMVDRDVTHRLMASVFTLDGHDVIFRINTNTDDFNLGMERILERWNTAFPAVMPLDEVIARVSLYTSPIRESLLHYLKQAKR